MKGFEVLIKGKKRNSMILKFVKKEVGKNKISLLYKNHNKELVQRLPHGGTKWVLDTKCREVEITEQLSIGHCVIVLVGKRKICFLCRREKKKMRFFVLYRNSP